MSDPVPDKRAAKFREMASKLTKDIAHKRADRRESTPKQVKEATAACIEADHLKRVRDALVKLADARDNKTLPDALAAISSKAQLLTMLRTRIDVSGGYYSIRDTGEWADTSATAVALRGFLDGVKSAADREGDAARAKSQRVDELVRDLKFRPIPGFFPTPADLCAVVRERALLTKPFLRVLEPSAGKGDLAEAMWTDAEGRPTHAAVHVCEVSRQLGEVLKLKGMEFVGEDFLATEPNPDSLYDRVVMNPPFENGQDAEHIRHAYRFLKPGGRLVAIASAGTFFRSDRKATEFRAWLESVGGECEGVQDGAFKKAFRSTGTKTCLVTIDKPAVVEVGSPLAPAA